MSVEAFWDFVAAYERSVFIKQMKLTILSI